MNLKREWRKIQIKKQTTRLNGRGNYIRNIFQAEVLTSVFLFGVRYFRRMEAKDLIRIAFADDHVSVRQGISAFLEGMGNIKVDIQADNGRMLMELLERADRLPDICMIDINMPVMDGFKLLEEIKKQWPEMKILVFTVFNREPYVIRMIKAGANGYLVKSCNLEEINAALVSIKDNGYYYSTVASNRVFESSKKVRLPNITKGESELLKYCCEEMTYAEIAQAIGTTPSSVEGYRDRLFNKLGVSSRIGLCQFAVANGYVPLETRI